MWRRKIRKVRAYVVHMLFSRWDIQHSYSSEAGDQVFFHETLDFDDRIPVAHFNFPIL